MAFSFDETNPTDSAVVSSFPANERSLRNQVKGWTNKEHGTASGRHKFPRGNTASRDGVTDWEFGSLYLNTDTWTVQWQDSNNPSSVTSWINAGGIPSGTKMLFAQASAPTGWTQDTSVNDRVLRVVSGTGGGTGGSWTISGLSISVASHALTEAELPDITIRFRGSSASGSVLPFQNASSEAFIGHGVAGVGLSYSATFGNGTKAADTPNTNGAAHSHTASISAGSAWRPAYKDCIIATKT